AKALFATRDQGATAAEYALLIAFIAAALVTVVGLFTGVLQGIFNKTCDSLTNSPSGTGC
ncbi:MAG TPA: Flp family type IVb pilin, partial [Micromonosporaceae bacterium]|nr:Flp family type IVb pilin [Micromonosporaceae bacterium]